MPPIEMDLRRKLVTTKVMTWKSELSNLLSGELATEPDN